MSDILCIDFGTSSVRAVRRTGRGAPRVLPIGKVAGSRLDDASIRSEIHVDRKSGAVRFGEDAIAARQHTRDSSHFYSSPKVWLKDPARLGNRISSAIAVSRAELISGLLANALRRCLDAERLNAKTLGSMDIRVAHPIWPDNVASKVKDAFATICTMARVMAARRDWSNVQVSEFAGYSATRAQLSAENIDVVEPIAAAVELLPTEENVRRLCAVVDVGAGTTDIGLFQAVVPDRKSSTVKAKLYPLGKAISVFKAGNYIDDIVFQLIESRASRATGSSLADIQARIRQVKETLFKTGFVQEGGARVEIKELLDSSDLASFVQDIRGALVRLITENEGTVVDMVNARTQSVGRLEVVMAGGGSSLPFLRAAIGKKVRLKPFYLPVEIVAADPGREVPTHGAGRERMAVALGGASPEYDALIHERLRPTMFRRGPM